MNIAEQFRPCLTTDCRGFAWTVGGARRWCAECLGRERRIAAMAKRLRKASHTAFGRTRECRYVAEAR